MDRERPEMVDRVSKEHDASDALLSEEENDEETGGYRAYLQPFVFVIVTS